MTDVPDGGVTYRVLLGPLSPLRRAVSRRRRQPGSSRSGTCTTRAELHGVKVPIQIRRCWFRRHRSKYNLTVWFFRLIAPRIADINNEFPRGTYQQVMQMARAEKPGVFSYSK